jgi:hypothetical protein
MIKNIITLATCGMVITTQAAVFVEYDFTGTSASINTPPEFYAATTAGEVTASPFEMSNLSWVGSTDALVTKGWNTANAIVTTEYLHFSVAANSGSSMNLTQLSWMDSIGTKGPTSGQVSIFLNGSSTATASMSFTRSTAEAPLNWDLAGITGVAGCTSVEFRFYGWNANTQGIDNRETIDKVALSGTVVPEPQTYCLVSGLGLLGLAVGRRLGPKSKQKKQS